MKYYPNMSIQYNAQKNGCSEAAVRKYIRVNHIDRRYEQQVNTINRLRKIINIKPEASFSEIAKDTHLSLNTVKKYYPYAIGEVDLSKSGTDLVSKIDTRAEHDYYASHPTLVVDLLRVESFHHCILEPCCGGGHIAEVLKRLGYDVKACDIVNRGYGEVADFLTYPFNPGERDIITNPPYFDSVSFMRRAVELCYNKVAFLMPLRYLSGKERYTFFKKYPPARVYAYINRIRTAQNASSVNSLDREDLISPEFERFERGTSLIMFAWFVWDKQYKGETVIRWIENDESAQWWKP